MGVLVRYALILIIMLSLAGCKFTVPGADQQFGKQNFVSAVALIELHKLRYGKYPDSLQDLKFLGDWDNIWLSAVKYKKVADGYNLYVERGWMNKPNLSFPVEFKHGLGIRGTNVKWTK